MAALTLLTYVNLVAALLASRMAFDAYGSTDLFAVGAVLLALVVAYLLGGFSNFFLRRPFVSDAVFSLLVMVTVAFVVINFFDQDGKPREFATGVDWRLIPAGLLVLFALWILAALALACSTRLDMIPTLAICSALFLVGIMSDYLFGRQAEPVWRHGLQAEVRSSRWSDSQRVLLKEIVDKYDQDQNGRLEAERGEEHYPGGQGAPEAGGHGRDLVGVGALHGHAKLAAFLARRRAGCGQEHLPLGLRGQGVWLHAGLCGRGAGHCHGVV